MTDENKQLLQDYIESHPDTIDNLDIKKIDEDLHVALFLNIMLDIFSLTLFN